MTNSELITRLDCLLEQAEAMYAYLDDAVKWGDALDEIDNSRDALSQATGLNLQPRKS